MCGIVGYVGQRQALPILIEGLKRLEYRGYDSAGIAIHTDNGLEIRKSPGKIVSLENCLNNESLRGVTGIAHTRWATHGEPNVVNAHPHMDCSNTIALVHNGIIENYRTLRAELVSKGHRFVSETDTEILVHLIEEFHKNGACLWESVRLALTQVKGTYGILVTSNKEPGTLVAARHGSPLVVGHGENEFFLASDCAPIASHTKEVTYLEDGEIVELTKDGVSFKTLDDEIIEKAVEKIGFDLGSIEKGGYEHYMLKEIMEQPQTIRDSMRGRLLMEEGTSHLGGLAHDIDSLLYARRILITACGTSWHAALIGEYMLEEFVRIPVEVEYASEFRYRDPILDADSVVIAISQSGETADTLAAVKEAKQKRNKVFGICNVVGSSIARETDAGVFLHAGPEIGVASTKAFTSQVTVLALITLLLGRVRSISNDRGRGIAQEMDKLPQKVAEALKTADQVKVIAEEFQDCRNFLYLGRGYNFPAALEGALKLKEISYIHAEGYPAAEMKHGPIALIDENMPVVFIATQDSTYDKIISNIEEVRARNGRVIAIATQGDEEISNHAEHVIYVPRTLEMLMPIVATIPLQLLAYYVATLRGCNVDQPRNLAKSVTVE